MIRFVDGLLNKITMYRLVLYYLIILLATALVLSIVGVLTYSPVGLLVSTSVLLLVCLGANWVFSKVFEAPTNLESVYITALILALVITPLKTVQGLPLLFWAGVLAMGTKYMFAIGNKHIFNPVCIAVVMTSYVIGASASWWVGNLYLAPLVFIGGLLIVRKIKREDMVFTFMMVALLVTFIFGVINKTDTIELLKKILFHSSYLFFAFVMITEPLTTPPTRGWQILYGGLVGLLFSPYVHLGSVYSTPELTLVIGNVFSYLVSPKEKYVMKLGKKIQLSSDTYDFVFPLKQKLAFTPGQYMEFTLPHDHIDDRGNRRYFTIASSPTEPELRIGIKFYDNSSSYKKAMLTMGENAVMVAGQRAGDFTLPEPANGKYVFMAGGIGVTPFRSIIKYLIDTNTKRDIVVLYSNKSKDEIVYADVFNEAQAKLGIPTYYTLTDAEHAPADWNGTKGRFTAEMIKQEIPDYMERIFYISGPHGMVMGFEDVLKQMGVPNSHIKVDFFPGFV